MARNKSETKAELIIEDVEVDIPDIKETPAEPEPELVEARLHIVTGNVTANIGGRIFGEMKAGDEVLLSDSEADILKNYVRIK